VLTALISFVIRRRQWVFLVILLLTVALATQIRNLRIVIDPASLLPQQHANVIGTNLAEKLFGSKYVIVVGVSHRDGSTVMTADSLKAIQALTTQLGDVPGVKRHTLLSLSADRAKSIQGKNNNLEVEPLLAGSSTAADIEQTQRNLEQNPLYRGAVVSTDQTLAAISFSVTISEKGFREVVDRVSAVARSQASDSIRISLTGTPVFFAAVERYSQRMGFLFPIALLLIGLLHFEAFRTLQGMLLPLVTAVFAVLWVLGVMGAIGLPLDAFNATTPILILAVAAGHAVQILKRYYEEFDTLSRQNPSWDPKLTNEKAILRSLIKIGPVMLTAGFVAAAGFFSLLFFDILTIKNFGRITGLGILVALLLELTMIPALRAMLAPPKQMSETQGNADRWNAIANFISTASLQHSARIILGFAVLVAFSLLGATQLNRENSTKSYFGRTTELRAEDDFLNARLPGTNTLYVVFDGAKVDAVKQPSLLAAIEKTQTFIQTLPDVGKTMSIVDLLKQMNRSMHNSEVTQHVLPSSAELISQYLLLYSMSGQPTDFDAYVDYDYRHANLIVWMKNDSSKYAESVVKQIKEFASTAAPQGTKIYVGGSVPQTSALSESLVKSKMLNIVQMIAVVFFAGALVFRSLLAALYLVLPLLTTVAVNFGVMGLTGIPLNTPNSVSSAMAIGIGADYAIYLMYRIREEIQQGSSLEQAIAHTIRTAGKAVVYVASAVIGGYAVLLFSFNFYVHVWFGILIVLSMFVSAATALLLVPALIRLHPPKFLRLQPQASISLPVMPSLLILVMLLASASNTMAAEDGAQALMQKSYDASRFDSSISKANFQLTSASGQQRQRLTYGATKLIPESDRNRRMIRFLAPADIKNTVTLMVEGAKGEDELWIYLPALKKARRLANSNKKGSFAGTDLSYGDVLGQKPIEWRHQLLRQESLDGVACSVIESLPLTAQTQVESGYAKRVSWISKDNLMPLKVDFFDTSGVALKTLLNKNIKLVDPAKRKYQAMLVLVSNVQTGHSTAVQFETFEANAPIAEEVFSHRYLEREE
jgi:uncharacterized protein